MIDILATVKTALNTAKKLKEVSEKLHDAELKNLLGDLNLELADIKIQLADVTNENAELRATIRQLESGDGEPCPRCRKRTWIVESSAPDPMMGDLGAIRRVYRCNSCGLSESKMITR